MRSRKHINKANHAGATDNDPYKLLQDEMLVRIDGITFEEHNLKKGTVVHSHSIACAAAVGAAERDALQ